MSPVSAYKLEKFVGPLCPLRIVYRCSYALNRQLRCPDPMLFDVLSILCKIAPCCAVIDISVSTCHPTRNSRTTELGISFRQHVRSYSCNRNLPNWVTIFSLTNFPDSFSDSVLLFLLPVLLASFSLPSITSSSESFKTKSKFSFSSTVFRLSSSLPVLVGSLYDDSRFVLLFSSHMTNAFRMSDGFDWVV